MSELVNFLLDRLADDEAVARAALVDAKYVQFGDTAAEALIGLAESEGAQQEALRHFDRHDPARVLAEVEAKRAIVARESALLHSWDIVEQGLDEAPMFDGVSRRERSQAQATLRHLAAPYASHEDFQEGWRA